MSNKKEIFWRIGLAYLMLILLGLGIIAQVFYIQNVKGSYYRSLADSISTKYTQVPAERGNIYSVDGRLLATSLPGFEIRMDMKADGLSKNCSDKMWIRSAFGWQVFLVIDLLQIIKSFL